ncbi:hypothetical protein [Anoxybacillus ayderensis]|uniref:hypothetical protein n=1 Tax=Anoxybacillus ayderensis TaxID=265546 RepID=UPI002E22257E|nr:hypothetical protein [Anoxybacillus ayderensis]
MKYSAKDIYRTGNQFFAASKTLNEKLSETNNVGLYIGPIITNLALAIELYLKCNYVLDRGKRPPNSHDLYNLYTGLNQESRNLINVLYEKFLEIDPAVKVMKEQMPEVDLKIESVLRQMNKAFVNWRYNHEGNFTSVPSPGPLVQALKARIEIENPEWKADI